MAEPTLPVDPRLRAGTVLRHYEIIRPLGSGGMGAVFLARDQRLGRLVAVKVISAHSRRRTDRFLIEARATAQLSHENVVVIHDVDEHDGAPYMVLEYLRGKTLEHILRERREQARVNPLGTTADATPSFEGSTEELAVPSEDIATKEGDRRSPPISGLPPQRAVELILPVVRALVYAHERGVVHRDLKPANIMVTDTGVVKVLDFGIAKLLGAQDAPADTAQEPPEPDPTRTRTGMMLGTQTYMSPEQWRTEPVDHRADIWAVGVMLAELLLGRHPLAPLSRAALAAIQVLDVPMPSLRELLPGAGKLGSIVDRCLIKRAADRTPSARDLCAELEALLPAARPTASTDGDHNPFVGLSAYKESDAGRFFGRSAEIAEVVAQLAEQPLLVIVGPSGAGKSSFVRAGLIPALGRAGDPWEVFPLRPGTSAMIALAELLLTDTLSTSSRDPHSPRSEAPPSEDREGLAAKLSAEPGLLGARLRALARRRLKRVLLFIDQAEELYTLTPAPERAAFFACLGGVADDVGSPLRAVMAIRSDFLDRMAEDRHALGAPGRGIVLLSPVSRDGLREALVQPLTAVDHRFDPPELIDDMLDALSSTRAALPLLSFTAARLWEQRDRAKRALTAESYLRMGGIGGALAGHADAVLGAMSADERRLSRAALLRLVTPERTRALCTLSELRGLSPEPEAMDRVLARWIDARLLAVDSGDTDATVELVHESLISGWPALLAWLAETQQDAVFLARLRHATKEWEAAGRTEDLLWRGQAADIARQWQKRSAGELTPAEEGYLRAVIDLAERERQRGRRIAAAVIITLSAIAMIVTGLAIRADRAADRAEALAASEAREKANAQKEALRARNATRLAVARELKSDPTAALALLREVEGEAPPGWADLTYTVLRAGVARVVMGGVQTAQWSPDGKRILSTADDNTPLIWNADGSGEPLFLRGHDKKIWSAEWSPDGERIVTTSDDGTIRLWSADGTTEPLILRSDEKQLEAQWSPDGKRIVTCSTEVDSVVARVWSADGTAAPLVLRGHEDRIFAVAWSPDSKHIVSSSWDKTLRVWDADGAGEPLVLRGHEDRVFAVAWSPDGKRIVSTSPDLTVRVWNADGTGEPILLRGYENLPLHARWSPDSRRILLLANGLDKTVRIWNADGAGEPLVLRGHEDAVQSAEWSPDGQHIVTASMDKTVRVWSADSSGDTFILGGHDALVWQASYSPDGRRIVSTSNDRTARVWDTGDHTDALILRAHREVIYSAGWNLDGTRVVTPSYDRTVRVWDIDAGIESHIFQDHDAIVWSAAWSPDGERIATASSDRTARIWRADGTGEPVVLRGHTSAVRSAAWSPDGERIATASSDRTARIWRADGTGEPILLRGHEERLDAAAWSPDGDRIATASWDRTARIWRADGIGEPIILRAHEGPVSTVAWSPDGRRVATVSHGIGRIWRADGSGDPFIIGGAGDKIFAAAFSPDSERIATAHSDHIVRVWSADGRGEPLALRGHKHWAYSLAWSQDGRRIASASPDRTVLLWSADGRGGPLILRGAKGFNHVAFSPDSTRIVAVSEDNSVWVWTDVVPLAGTDDPRLWTATTYCMSVERRIELLDMSETLARAQQQACLARVAEARASARARAGE